MTVIRFSFQMTVSRFSYQMTVVRFKYKMTVVRFSYQMTVIRFKYKITVISVSYQMTIDSEAAGVPKIKNKRRQHSTILSKVTSPEHEKSKFHNIKQSNSAK